MRPMTVEEAIAVLKRIPNPKSTPLYVFSDSADRYENVNTIEMDEDGDAVVYIS